MKKTIYIITSVLLININFAASQNAGTTSSMFKVFVSPKIVSVGGAYGVVYDIDTALLNPAGIGGIQNKQVSLAYNSWLLGTSYSYVGFGLPFGKLGSLGVLINYFSSGDIEVTDIQGPTGDKFSAYGINTSLVYSKVLIDKISIGCAFKYILESIEKESASTVSMDIGCIYELSENIKFGVSLQNLFGSIKFIKEEDPLPFVVRVTGGVSLIDNLSLLLDVGVPSDGVLGAGGGVEYVVSIKDVVIPLRVGYRSGTDAFLGVALGLGFGYKDIVGLNLSWLPGISELNQHTFNAGLSFKF